jgi:hypothetical protein
VTGLLQSNDNFVESCGTQQIAGLMQHRKTEARKLSRIGWRWQRVNLQFRWGWKFIPLCGDPPVPNCGISSLASPKLIQRRLVVFQLKNFICRILRATLISTR